MVFTTGSEDEMGRGWLGAAPCHGGEDGVISGREMHF